MPYFLVEWALPSHSVPHSLGGWGFSATELWNLATRWDIFRNIIESDLVQFFKLTFWLSSCISDIKIWSCKIMLIVLFDMCRAKDSHSKADENFKPSSYGHLGDSSPAGSPGSVDL